MSEPVGTGDMLGRTPWSEHRRSSASKTWGLREKYSEKIVPYFHICACFFAVNSRNSILKTPGRLNRSQIRQDDGRPGVSTALSENVIISVLCAENVIIFAFCSKTKFHKDRIKLCFSLSKLISSSLVFFAITRRMFHFTRKLCPNAEVYFEIAYPNFAYNTPKLAEMWF